MPSFEKGGLLTHYELSGAGPLLVLSHSLGTDLDLWTPQLPALEGGFRVLRYDIRGHGRSTVVPGPYTIELLARDVCALLDALSEPSAHFCGLSIGGLIGMWLGAFAPERVRKLALCNTSPRIGTEERWNARIESVRARGMAAIADEVLERWFTPGFRARPGAALLRTRRTLEATPPLGYAACSQAIRDADLREAVKRIRTPTLVVSGTHDPATTAAEGRALAEAIPGARYVELAASHISNVEATQAFDAALLRFLNE